MSPLISFEKFKQKNPRNFKFKVLHRKMAALSRRRKLLEDKGRETS